MRILVIGDSCRDVYVYGRCDRLCPDAPVPVLIPTKTIENGGMASNVYDNLISLKVDTDLLTNKQQIIKTRYVDEKTNQMLVRIDTGEHSIDRIDISIIDFDSYDAIIISDYVKGFLEDEDIDYICEHHPLTIIDTKRLLNGFCKNATFIKVNELEYNNSKHLIEDGHLDDKLLITLGSKGCTHRGVNYPVSRVEVKDQTGAGDTFVSAFTKRYLETKDVADSIRFANDCSTIIVQKRGVNKIGEFI
jgi:D-beta-D-heptose 7-phosphate kinase/D-beta-D-heptose 1-phosphate adenosyltransferase